MYTLPDLPYSYGALAPVISEEIMQLHHSKHHQAYVDKLNAAIAQAPELQERSLVSLLENVATLPEAVRTAVRNQGGGHYNHSLFWNCMSPNGGGVPAGTLGVALIAKWGDFDSFVSEFNEKALTLFGSGWVWLTRDLEIIAMPNQDTPMMLGKGEPLMGLDVWEHAYYLDYRNKRDDYIENWWQVVNWEFVQRRFDES